MTEQPDLRARIDAALREFLARASGPLQSIAGELAPFSTALEAFLLDGGKRIRPAFCYWGHRAAGGDDGAAIVRAAASLELLHAGALVHDDLIDRSDSRRGAPSVHRRFAELHRGNGWHGDSDAFGEAAAILLGDLALVWADELLTSSGFDAYVINRALPIWNNMRVEVMCGQYLDVAEQARGGESLESALRVARYKSAGYTVERPLQLGAALAGAPDSMLDALGEFGVPLGEAFQLRDDLLGVYGDPAATGKPAGDDLREGKRTVLVAVALARSSAAEHDLITTRLGDRTLDDEAVDVLRDTIAASGARDEVERMIGVRLDAALRALDRLDIEEESASALRRLALAATERTE